MERSELLAETLGEHVFEWFIRNKRAEWDAYKAQVTQFELRPLPPAALIRWTDGPASLAASPSRTCQPR